MGEQKLQAMNERILSSVEIRDELEQVSSQIRAALGMTKPRAAHIQTFS